MDPDNNEDPIEYEEEMTTYYQNEADLSCGDTLSVILESGPLYVDPIDIIEFYFDEQRSRQPTRPMENGLQQICFNCMCIEGPVCYLTTRGDIKFGQLETTADECDPYFISLVSPGLCFLKIQFKDGDKIRLQEGIVYHNKSMQILYDKAPSEVGIVEFLSSSKF